MAISSGTRLGPYEVLAPLGAGGMGEVYRAQDTRLGREVALKVLPSKLSSDREWLKRFEREAQSASALNHPNIVTIYDVGSSDSIHWIAMEKVEGKTLREILLGGSSPMRKLLPVAAQIADGLARAHEAGIVHRDLKPENVMVRKDGLVKILDFGLAKLTQGNVGSGGGAQLPTQTGTSPGVVMGTVGYMSPEQAAGQPVDSRSDQFSFGAIVYEMVTGERAFQGKTAVDTLSAILHEDPKPIAEINPLAPAPLRWTVERCLAKDPEARYASSKDLARDFASIRDHISEVPGSGPAPVAAGLRPRVRVARMAGLAGALAAGLLAGRFLWQQTQAPPSFRRLTFRSGQVFGARFAPDGRTIVYSAQWGTDPVGIFSTLLGTVESRPLGTAGAYLLSISSSGEMLVLRGLTLARASLAGGAEREILEGVLDAAWAPNGKDIAVVRRPVSSGPFGVTGARLEFPIGKVLYETTHPISSPRVSPGGDQVAFVEYPFRGGIRGSMAVVDSKGAKRQLSEDFSSIRGAAWSPRGDEIWFSAAAANEGEAIRAVNLAGRGRIVARGAGSQVLEDVSADGRILLSHWHSRSVLNALPPGDTRERDLSWLDGSRPFALSEDGGTLLFTEVGEGSGSPTYSTWKRKMDGSTAVRLGDGMGEGLSPDGKWVLAIRLDPRPAQLLLIPMGAGETKVLTQDQINHRAAAWFPDGRRVLFLGDEPGKGPRLYTQALEGGGPHAITAEATRGTMWMTWQPISPDGRRVVFFDGQYLLYPVDGGDPRPIPGLVPGEIPVGWDREGRTLYVRDRQTPVGLFRLDVSTGQRQSWRVTAAPDREAHLVATLDGKSYAYSYETFASDLYLVEGLK